MAIFGPKPWVKLFTFLRSRISENAYFWPILAKIKSWKNVNFSTFSTSCFYSLEKRFFVLEYRKTHFPRLYCLEKKTPL